MGRGPLNPNLTEEAPLGVPSRATLRVDTEADMASPQSEADRLLSGQSFRKEGERRLVAEPRPLAWSPEMPDLEPGLPRGRGWGFV